MTAKEGVILPIEGLVLFGNAAVKNIQILILKFILLPKQHISEELFQIFCVHVDAFGHVCIICANQGVAEIPVSVSALMPYADMRLRKQTNSLPRWKTRDESG